MSLGEDFQRDYRRVATTAATSQLASDEAQAYCEKVQAQLDQVVDSLTRNAATNRPEASARGFAAEEYHIGTHNVEMSARGQQPEAHKGASFHDPADISFGEHHTDPVQVKYYDDPTVAARVLSQAKYDGMDRLVQPEMVEQVRAEALRLAEETRITDPEQAQRYLETAHRLTDRLDHGGQQSHPLSDARAQELVDQPRRDNLDLDREAAGLTPDDFVRLSDVGREALHAGAQAAAVGAAMAVAPVVVAAIQQAFRDGELDLEELGELARAAPAAVLRSGISGSITAGLVTATQSGMLGTTLTAVPPDVIAYTVVLSINCLQSSYRAATGEISWSQASTLMAKDGLALAGAFAGAAVGGAIIPIPVVGSMIGSMVGATVARILIDQSEGFLMGLAVSHGWTYFGIVSQDYTLPEQALRDAGFDVAELDKLDLDEVELDILELEEIDLDVLEVRGIEFRVLRRGLIGIGTVGYV